MDGNSSDEDIISIDGPLVHTDDDVDAAWKFLVRTPAIMEKQAKARDAKEKRVAKRKAAGDNDTIQKGPFSLPVSEPYSALLSAIATELPCRKEHINESKIVWKPKKTKNAEELPLSKAAGYKAMLDEMKDKAEGSRQVLLYMPAPAKPMDDQTPWETDGNPEPSFDYSELEPTLPSDSLIAQKQLLNKATKNERAKLEEKYPVGYYPQFPDLHVYHDPSTGFYYELNTMRSGVWASAMAQGKTDKNTPPVSKIFDQPTPAIPAIPTAPAVAGSSLSITDLLFASLLSQPGSGSLAALIPGLNPVPSAAPAPVLPANSAPHSHSAPSSPVKRHTVSLAQFAENYNLEDGDAELLMEATLDEELKKIGFTFFSWKHIHNANVRFKADLAAGINGGLFWSAHDPL
ncbi:hypothetical protein DFH08DRAFT_824429 [Mycena albidolilacea]|uniref:Uncharacterized protein n=1 Tax=Mycena albidolilacea TaxID=1033008 RepID=A0AAD6Z560_9AGAR|nr:hypothetical protein DFH08DRAFT_824429 [Mycena albidolilacea]